MQRTYVVTGAGRGIGRAVVERLLADGAAAVAAVERDPDALAWAGDRVLRVTGDAADPATAAAAADRAEAAGALTGWVNNAAVFRDASLHTAPLAEVRALIAANLDPALAGCAVAVRRFLAAGRGGAIVNVSSHQARAAVPGCLPYATAKAALEGMTRALAAEYGPHGIRVNAVAPGTIRTERYDTAQDPVLRGLHALGRVGEAGEVADVVALLLGDGASFVTGATVPVDGGRAVLARETPLPPGADG